MKSFLIIIILLSFIEGIGQTTELPLEIFKSKFKDSVYFDTVSHNETNNLFLKYNIDCKLEPNQSSYFFALISYNSLITYKTICEKQKCRTNRFRIPNQIDSIKFNLNEIPESLKHSFLISNEFQLRDRSTYVVHDGSQYLFRSLDSNGERCFWTDFLNEDQKNILLFHLFIFNELSNKTIKRIIKGEEMD